MTDEPWLTKRELAAKLRVSIRTVERRIEPTVRVGRQNRYWVSDALRQLRAESRLAEVAEMRPSRKRTAA